MRARILDTLEEIMKKVEEKGAGQNDEGEKT